MAKGAGGHGLGNSAWIGLIGGNTGGHLGGSEGGHLATKAGSLRACASSALELQAPRDVERSRYNIGESVSDYAVTLVREHGGDGSLDNSIRRAQDENACLKAAADNLQDAILGYMQHEGQSVSSQKVPQSESVDGSSRGGPPLILREESPQGQVPAKAPQVM